MNPYIKAFTKKNYNTSNKKALLLYLTRAINNGYNKDNPKLRFQHIRMAELLISNMHIKDFVNTFPIDKIYDGKRYECKDYFTTMELVNKIGDNIIGDNVDDVLWDYQNKDIRMLGVNRLMCVDDLMALEGKKSLISQFFEDKGIDSYAKRVDGNGKEYMVNNRTGKTHSIKKVRKFKVIKGGQKLR